MDLDDIKRGLRAEIKKRENEHYLTFQCNVRQMCKDVLAKLEEQESEIAEKDKEIAELKERIADGDKDFEMAAHQNERLLKIVRHKKYKRCFDKAKWCNAELWNIRNTPLRDMNTHELWQHDDEFWQRWYERWLELAEQFKDKEAK